MKKFLLFLSFSLLAVSFVDIAAQQKKPRIGIAGIQIENSVFVPNRQPIVGIPLTLPDYLSPDSLMGQAATWLPALVGRGGGRGPVTRDSYDAFVSEALLTMLSGSTITGHAASTVFPTRKVSLWKRSVALSGMMSSLRPRWIFMEMLLGLLPSIRI